MVLMHSMVQSRTDTAYGAAQKYAYGAMQRYRNISAALSAATRGTTGLRAPLAMPATAIAYGASGPAY
eukprot:689537-Rhodomonas_salina.3